MTDPIQTLTSAQKEVLRLVHRGMTTKEIAIELGLSGAAVDDRVEAARVKLGHVRRATAARRLVEAEGGPQPLGGSPEPLGLHPDPISLQADDAVDQNGTVREQRAIFNAMQPEPLIARLGSPARSGLIVAFTISLLAVAALIKPMIDGVTWLVAATERFFR